MIPDFQTLMRPVLAHLADGEAHRSREVKDAMADQFGLSDAERAELLPSGKQRTIDNRVGWALTYLSQAGLVARPSRGIVQITDQGRAALATNPTRVDMRTLEDYPSYREFKERTRKAPAGAAQSPPSADLGDEDATPHDRISAAVEEVNETVAAELLTRINEQPPDFLERVVLDLLVAMGYTGALGTPEHLGRSGDEGIDGVLKQDALGLDRIYVQAKRYSSGRPVGRPDIQAFVGALHGAQATRGVFITTSRFSDEARDFTRFAPQRLVLIDGHELSRLMVTHGVGVQTEQTFTLKKIDEDFFE